MLIPPSADAAGSAARGTSSGISVCQAGMLSVTPQPSRKVKASSSGGEDPAYSRPIAAPLEKCAELLGVDLATVRLTAEVVEPYIPFDGTKV
jgi:hypothetical protein